MFLENIVVGKTAFGIFKAPSGIRVLLQPCDQQSGSLSVVVTDFFSVCVCVCVRERGHIKIAGKAMVGMGLLYLHKIQLNSVKICRHCFLSFNAL